MNKQNAGKMFVSLQLEYVCRGCMLVGAQSKIKTDVRGYRLLVFFILIYDIDTIYRLSFAIQLTSQVGAYLSLGFDVFASEAKNGPSWPTIVHNIRI